MNSHFNWQGVLCQLQSLVNDAFMAEGFKLAWIKNLQILDYKKVSKSLLIH